jgi:hypothetical protein
MKNSISLTVTTLLLAVCSLSAATHYVSLGSTNPTSPFTNWVTAARTIQDALNVAVANDVVLVTNGVYPGYVSVTNALALLSVNGPQFTVINGRGTNRCVDLTYGASLTGFTLNNGYAQNGYGGYGGGGVCASQNAFLTNCLIVGNSASRTPTVPLGGGGAAGCTLYNCTLSGNSAHGGGGAIGCTLYNCTLSGNSALSGGGAYSCTLYNCTLSDNWANGSGAGAWSCTLYNCTLSGNSALAGGGAWGSKLYNCTLTGNSGSGASQCTLYNCTLTGNNSALGDGGGAFSSTLYNCTLIGNSAAADSYGGGASASTLYNCTLSGNSALAGGGAYGGTLYNCILYFNTAPGAANYDSSTTLNYCCATPLPATGAGNITNVPLFVDSANGNLRLQSNSPCINAGNNAYVSGTTDLDGRPRIVGGRVDLGAYEFQPGVSGAFIGWLQQYGLPTDGSADYADPDHDSMNNWQEWVCDTNPTNRLSALRLLSPSITSTDVTVTWQSVAGVIYFLERSANPAAPFMHLANILGQSGTTSYGDTNAAGKGPFFYRVGVKGP